MDLMEASGLILRLDTGAGVIEVNQLLLGNHITIMLIYISNES